MKATAFLLSHKLLHVAFKGENCCYMVFIMANYAATSFCKTRLKGMAILLVTRITLHHLDDFTGLKDLV